MSSLAKKGRGGRGGECAGKGREGWRVCRGGEGGVECEGEGMAGVQKCIVGALLRHRATK